MSKTGSISDILKLLMFKQNIRAAELARRVNLPQQTMQRIVSGSSPSPHNASLQPLADFFGVSLEQLKGLEPIPGLEMNSGSVATFPGISTVYLIEWNQVSTWPLQITAENHTKIFTDAKLSGSGFALRTKDSSMTPLFPAETILIVDPHLKPADRQYVIVKLKDQPEATFRQLLIDMNYYYLKPLSPDLIHLPMIQLTAQDKICGVVVQSKRDYYA